MIRARLDSVLNFMTSAVERRFDGSDRDYYSEVQRRTSALGCCQPV